MRPLPASRSPGACPTSTEQLHAALPPQPSPLSPCCPALPACLPAFRSLCSPSAVAPLCSATPCLSPCLALPLLHLLGSSAPRKAPAGCEAQESERRVPGKQSADGQRGWAGKTAGGAEQRVCTPATCCPPPPRHSGTAHQPQTPADGQGASLGLAAAAVTIRALAVEVRLRLPSWNRSIVCVPRHGRRLAPRCVASASPSGSRHAVYSRSCCRNSGLGGSSGPGTSGRSSGATSPCGTVGEAGRGGCWAGGGLHGRCTRRRPTPPRQSPPPSLPRAM